MKFIFLMFLSFSSLNSIAGPGGFMVYSSEDGMYKVCEDWLGTIKVGLPNREKRVHRLEASEDNLIYMNSKIGVEFYVPKKLLIDYDEDVEVQLELKRKARYGICHNFLLNKK